MTMYEQGEGIGEAFAMVTQEGLYSRRRVPWKVLNATPHFQSTMDGDVLRGLVGVICKVWVDGMAHSCRAAA